MQRDREEDKRLYAALEVMHDTQELLVLGLERTATAEQVQAAYGKLAMKHHPDRGGSAEAFRNVTEARDLALQMNMR
jgi:DnaJ-class molecular chaperone